MLTYNTITHSVGRSVAYTMAGAVKKKKIPFPFPPFSPCWMSFDGQLVKSAPPPRGGERRKGTKKKRNRVTLYRMKNSLRRLKKRREGDRSIGQKKKKKKKKKEKRNCGRRRRHSYTYDRAPSTNKGKCQSPQFSYSGQSSDESIHCNCVVSIIRQRNAIRRNEGRKEEEKQRAE